MRGKFTAWIMVPLTPIVPAGAQKNRLRPFGGEKVHWTFSCFRLTSRRERGFRGNFRFVRRSQHKERILLMPDGEFRRRLARGAVIVHGRGGVRVAERHAAEKGTRIGHVEQPAHDVGILRQRSLRTGGEAE